MPLTTTCTRLVMSKCGCALTSLTRPCVAQRVWPMPVVTDLGRGGDAAGLVVDAPRTASPRCSRLPTARTESIALPGDHRDPR